MTDRYRSFILANAAAARAESAVEDRIAARAPEADIRAAQQALQARRAEAGAFYDRQFSHKGWAPPGGPRLPCR